MFSIFFMLLQDKSSTYSKGMPYKPSIFTILLSYSYNYTKFGKWFIPVSMIHLPTIAGIRLFRSKRHCNFYDFRLSSAIEPMRQLMKLASFHQKRQYFILWLNSKGLNSQNVCLQFNLFLLRHRLNNYLSLLRFFLTAFITFFVLATFLNLFDLLFVVRIFLSLHGVCEIIYNGECAFVTQLIRVIITIGKMKAALLISALALLATVNCIVDRTYFNYLGLKITASPEDVQKAYDEKKVKLQALPNQEEREKKLKLLKQAYDTLINEKERQKYERYGKDIFRSIKEMTCIDKRNPQSPRDQRKSPSFKLTIPVSIGDIFNGTVIKAKYPKPQACPVCQGTGAKSPKELRPCSQCAGKGFSLREEQNFYGQRFTMESVCPVCRGAGKLVGQACSQCRGSKLITKVEVIQIPIPKGLPNGNTFTLRNYGEQSLHGAPSDFQITVVEVPTKEWSRQGSNLVYTMEISLEQSLFGFKRTFQHLDGSQVAVNREGVLTTKETKHMVRERGIINKQGYAGNLIVKFRVIIPTFTDQQLDMWEDFFNEYPI